MRLAVLSTALFLLMMSVSAQPPPEPPTFVLDNNINAVFDQNTYLKPSNPGQDDDFGRAVAIDGNTLVVGAYHEDGNGSSPGDNTATNAGAVYVFERQGQRWVQQAYLKASNAGANDEFGRAVDIDGDTLVVGAPREDGDGSSFANNDAVNAGAVYVFVRDGAGWVEQAYLKPDVVDSPDNFGWSVSLDGDTLAVGAPFEEGDGSGPTDNTAAGAGAAYVFERDGTSWDQVAYLKASNVGTNDRFGWSVAVEETRLVVGAIGESSDGSSPTDNSATSAGAVYAFVRPDTVWLELAYLKANNAGSGDEFGSSVALSGTTVIVGAPNEDWSGSGGDNDADVDSGAAYVFVPQGATLVEQAHLKASDLDEDDNFGHSVALNGDTALVGAPFADFNRPTDAGAAYVFQRQNEIWTQQTLLEAPNADDADEYGYSVALDEATLVVGATGEDSDGSDLANNDLDNAGAVYGIDVLSEFASSPAPPGPLVMSADNPTVTVRVANRTTGSFLLNVVLDSITPGYSIASGLPITGLPGMGNQPAIVVACDEPGTTPENGTLVLQTNETDTPVYSYDLICEPPPTPTPTATDTPTATNTATSTATPTPTSTPTNTPTPTNTATVDPDATATPTPTNTATVDPDATATPTPTNTATVAPDATATPTPTNTATVAPDATATPTPTNTATVDPDATATPTDDPNVTPTATNAPIDDSACAVDDPLCRVAPANGAVITSGADYVANVQWRPVPDAEWYHVFISVPDFSQVFFDRWYQAAEVCSGDLCTAPDGLWLVGNQDYAWWMTYWSPGVDYLNLYEETRFTLNLPLPPIPTGQQPAQSGNEVTFIWQAEPNTLWYNVWVGPADYTDTLFLEWQDASRICFGGVCSVTIMLPSGDHELWLQAWNPASTTGWQFVSSVTVP